MARGFNGTTDRIDYGNVNAVAAQAQSFSALLFVDAVNDGDVFFVKMMAGDARWANLFRFNANEVIQVKINRSTSDLLQTSNVDSFPLDEWFHLLVTWDGSVTASNVHTYVNGSEVGYATTTNGIGDIETPGGSWCLGGWRLGDNTNLDGYLAEVGWWNRVLSAGEIASLNKRFTPRFILNGLKFAPDLIRNQRDIISGEAGTLDGTTVVKHPQIIVPRRAQNIVTPDTTSLKASADIVVITEAVVNEEGTLGPSVSLALITGVDTSSEQTLSMSASVAVSTDINVHEEAEIAGNAAIELITIANVTLGYVFEIAASASIIANTSIADMCVEATLTPSADIVISTELNTIQTSLLKSIADVILSTQANANKTVELAGSADIITAAQAAIYKTYVDIPPAMHEDLIDPYSGGAWLWLAEIAVPGYSTERIARNTADVRYGGNDFEKFNLQIGEQMFSGDGSIPRVTLKVFQDVNRKIEDIVNETEGALGAGIKLIKVCEKFLDTPISALEADYENLAAESDSEWVTFTLGIPNPLTQRIPLRIYSASMCPWATPSLFKGPECQYAGEDGSCTGTYEDCYQKGNAVHWGGELGLVPKVI